jgi:hypothetical protein
MKSILCVIHLAQSSVKVLEIAVSMALAYKTHLTILFPYRTIDAGHGEPGKLKARLEHEAQEKFALLKKQVPSIDFISYDFQPETGFPSDRINSYVKKNVIHTIVISQRHANTIDEINPMALQHLIMKWKLPFMIIPEDADVEAFLSTCNL